MAVLILCVFVAGFGLGRLYHDAYFRSTLRKEHEQRNLPWRD